jgi:hypothetical protein
MALTIEQLKLAFAAFRNFRVTASQCLFEKIFGVEMADHYWFKFTDVYRCDVAGFYGYLDEAYKEVLLKYILTVIVPKMEAVA